MTRRVLVAVSTTRFTERLVEHALEEAMLLRGKGEEPLLDVLYVDEEGSLETADRKVGEGFLGMRPQREVMDTLAAERERTTQRRLDRIVARAAEHGIPVEITEVEGAFADEVLAHAERVHPHLILVTRADRPFLLTMLLGSESERLARAAQAEGLGRVIVDDDDA